MLFKLSHELKANMVTRDFFEFIVEVTQIAEITNPKCVAIAQRSRGLNCSL